MEAFFLWLVKLIGETAFGKSIGDTLEEWFPEIFKNKTKEIVDIYESRLEEKNNEIRDLERERLREQRERETEEGRLIGSLKRRSIATEKLIEQYHKPLNAVVVSYASQHEERNGKVRSSHFLRDELNALNSKYLGGTDALIPPASVPQHIKSQADLKKWFEEEILKGRYCKVKFLILFDIRKNAMWGTYLPYAQKKPMHHSLGEVLSLEDVFTEEQIERLAISEIIKGGDIAWLASVVVSERDIEVILRNQKAIEGELGNPSLLMLADVKIKAALVAALGKYIQGADQVADAVIDEAKFWSAKIKG